MKISPAEYQAILELVKKERWKGNEFLAFRADNSISRKDDLTFFPTVQEAEEFCYVLTTESDPYDYLAVRSVYRTMSEALQDKSLLIEHRGMIDVATMVSEWYRKLESRELTDNQKQDKMNMKNFEYLRDQIKSTGFGEALEDNLKTAIEKGKPEFKLNHYTQYGNDTVSTELNFSKSKQSDMYFFNSYQVGLQKEGAADRMEQMFYINKGNNITLKEAYNLMSGRSVNKDLTNKEGQVYNVWVQMDFKQSSENGNFKLKHYHQNYGYDLEETLSKHPIRELTNSEFKNNLIESLKKGNLQSATFQKDGTDQKQFIEANPQFKTINVYDGNMQRVDSRQAKSEKQSVEQGQSTKQEAKKEKQSVSDDEGPDMPQTSKRKRRKQAQAV